jgi:hypothetical protein
MKRNVYKFWTIGEANLFLIDNPQVRDWDFSTDSKHRIVFMKPKEEKE